MERFVSDAFDIAEVVGSGFNRADLVFYEVEHGGPSFVARVFLDNPRATTTTPTTAASGYAGMFTVFGHGDCYGDEGHCEPRRRRSDAFDRRAPHPLEPLTKTVVITDALRRVRGTSLTVTVVAVDASSRRVKASDALRFAHLRLAVYDGYDLVPTPARRARKQPAKAVRR
jgi:tyrosinase